MPEFRGEYIVSKSMAIYELVIDAHTQEKLQKKNRKLGPRLWGTRY